MGSDRLRAIHPGEFIADALAELAMTQTELSNILDISKQYLNDVVNGRKGLTVELSVKLPLVLGSTPEFWSGLQQRYDLKKAQEDENVQEELVAIQERLVEHSVTIREMQPSHFKEGRLAMRNSHEKVTNRKVAAKRAR